MGRIKEWGFQIAHMLFEESKSVEYVVAVFARPVVILDSKGGEEIIPPDIDWLTEQVQAVKDRPEEWGYTNLAELKPKRYRRPPRRPKVPKHRRSQFTPQNGVDNSEEEE